MPSAVRSGARSAPTARRALVAALALLAAAVGPSVAGTDPGTNAAKSYADHAVSATNHARSSRHVPALNTSSCLHRAAVAQAKRMAASSVMAHQDLGRVIRGCALTRAGENVAYGFPDGTSVVVHGWMKSSGHRANILDARYTQVGIGARKDAHGVWYVSQVFGGR